MSNTSVEIQIKIILIKMTMEKNPEIIGIYLLEYNMMYLSLSLQNK